MNNSPFHSKYLKEEVFVKMPFYIKTKSFDRSNEFCIEDYDSKDDMDNALKNVQKEIGYFDGNQFGKGCLAFKDQHCQDIFPCKFKMIIDDTHFKTVTLRIIDKKVISSNGYDLTEFFEFVDKQIL